MRSELVLLTGLALCGCGATAESSAPAGEEASVTEAGVSGPLYYFARPDYRKCAYPMCGGTWIRRANFDKTKCADKTWQDECYVASIDYAALGLTDDEVATFDADLEAGLAIVRGSLGKLTLEQGVFGALKAVEGHRAVTGSEPTGNLYLVESSGIVCITYPCPSLHEQKLNSTSNANIAGVDLAPTDATQEQIDAAFAGLAAGKGFVVSGKHRTVKGPGGKSKEIVASELYAPVLSAAVPCGNATCEQGSYCCNASCSVCAPEGWACTQQACAPE